jgi:membrane protease YdiL (CAAX protease family)
MDMPQPDYQRNPAWIAPGSEQPNDSFAQFKLESGNENYRRSVLTWISLIFLLLIYPAQSLLAGEDFTRQLENINQGILIIMLVATIIVQWGIFLLLFVTAYREGTGLRGLGLVRIRSVDFLWAIAFLLAANLILSALAWLLAQIGLPMPGELAFLIPSDPAGKAVWVAVSFTAGFCEEIAFRGYLMTRLRLLGRFQSWVIPVVISSVAFGACHAYQGWPGFIVISVYGLLFAALYLRTKRLWPVIIAHSLQDLSALFIPQ